MGSYLYIYVIHGELGRKPLQCQRLYNIVKFWIKIMQSDDHKYIKIVYNILRNDMLDRPTCGWIFDLGTLCVRGSPEHVFWCF